MSECEPQRARDTQSSEMFGRNRFPKSSHMQKHLDIQPNIHMGNLFTLTAFLTVLSTSVLTHKRKEQSTTEGIASPRAALIPL